MPEEYKNYQMKVFCYDCDKKSEVKYHFLGGKCQSCQSYNTTQIGDAVEVAPTYYQSAKN